MILKRWTNPKIKIAAINKEGFIVKESEVTVTAYGDAELRYNEGEVHKAYNAYGELLDVVCESGEYSLYFKVFAPDKKPPLDFVQSQRVFMRANVGKTERMGVTMYEKATITGRRLFAAEDGAMYEYTVSVKEYVDGKETWISWYFDEGQTEKND